MAYQYRQQVGQTKKTKFISLNAGYHGDTLGTVSVGGIQLFHEVFHNLLFKPITLPSPGVYRDVAEREQAFEESLAELERILDREGDEITALVMEPLVQAAAGMLVMPKGYLKRVRELTKAHDVFLIVDEVATGFGRTGTFFACEQEDVAPDFMTLSKGITGGYMPLAATLTTKQVFDGFLGTFEERKTFYHGHSYTGNALACAVALASLQVFRDEHVMEQLPAKIEAFTKALKPIESLEHVKEVRQRGLIVGGIELEKDVKTHEAYRPNDAVGAKVAVLAREQGLICRPIGGDVVILMPPLASTVEQLEDMVRIVGESIRRATEEEGVLEDMKPIIL
nr:aminotransferase class III-fold pyridoxal phosphate-dependent enzyme [Veillonella denticariosi]